LYKGALHLRTEHIIALLQKHLLLRFNKGITEQDTFANGCELKKKI